MSIAVSYTEEEKVVEEGVAEGEMEEEEEVVVVIIVVVIIMDQAMVGHVGPSILTMGTICFVVLLGCILKFSCIFFERFAVKISAHYLTFIIVFLSPSRQMPGQYLKFGKNHLLLYRFPLSIN